VLARNISIGEITSYPLYRFNRRAIAISDKLRGNILLKQHVLEIDLRHVSLFNDELAHVIQDRPADVLPLVCPFYSTQVGIVVIIGQLQQFEDAATRIARNILFPLAGTSEEGTQKASETISKIQVTIKSGLNLLQVRELTANTMNKLVRIPGIVISASTLTARATRLHLQCRGCQSVKIIHPQGGLGGMGSGSDRGLPRVCDAEDPNKQKDCPLDPYLIIHPKSMFADQQTLKLQEAPDMVPVGELPRHMLLSADRYLTGKVVPGSRVIASGIYSQFQSSKQKGGGTAALRQPYLRLVHLELMSPAGTAGTSPFGTQFTPEQEEEFEQMARTDGLYERFSKSIAPSIYGSLGGCLYCMLPSAY